MVDGSGSFVLGYPGGYSDIFTGLVFDEARWYDPTTGQFLSTDPLAQQTLQPFAYAEDDPQAEADPSGTKACTHLPKGLTCLEKSSSAQNDTDPTGSWQMRFTMYSQKAQDSKGRTYVDTIAYGVRMWQHGNKVTADLRITAACLGATYGKAPAGKGCLVHEASPLAGRVETYWPACPAGRRQGPSATGKGCRVKSGRLYLWAPPGWSGLWTGYNNGGWYSGGSACAVLWKHGKLISTENALGLWCADPLEVGYALSLSDLIPTSIESPEPDPDPDPDAK